MPNDMESDQKCYKNGRLTKTERSLIFPFSEAEKVRVVSFKSSLGKTPIENDTIIESLCFENIELNDNQIDNLTEVLYNYNYSKKSNMFVSETAGCYYPRQAIIFLDINSKVTDYIEFCFECQAIKTELSYKET